VLVLDDVASFLVDDADIAADAVAVAVAAGDMKLFPRR